MILFYVLVFLCNLWRQEIVLVKLLKGIMNDVYFFKVFGLFLTVGFRMYAIVEPL